METRIYSVTSDAFTTALELSGFNNCEPGSFMRISPTHLCDFIGSAECLPIEYVDKVRETTSAGISGDFVLGFTKDSRGNPYLSLLVVRAGKDCKNDEKMKQDAFAIRITPENSTDNKIQQCLHGDYSCRYSDPSLYDVARNGYNYNTIYNPNTCMETPELSAIASIYGTGFDYIMKLQDDQGSSSLNK